MGIGGWNEMGSGATHLDPARACGAADPSPTTACHPERASSTSTPTRTKIVRDLLRPRAFPYERRTHFA